MNPREPKSLHSSHPHCRPDGGIPLLFRAEEEFIEAANEKVQDRDTLSSLLRYRKMFLFSLRDIFRGLRHVAG
jgi:hypothetical protein